MHTGQVMMFHGPRDQRVWDIGSTPDTVAWHPNLLVAQTPFSLQSQPDMFCTGHAQLSDGRIFFAGGNINGNALGGGLYDTFIYDPVGANPNGPGLGDSCPFGWVAEQNDMGFYQSPTDLMQHDRWYPTLTALRDGRILISGGWSLQASVAPNVEPNPADHDAVRSRLLEVYDPTDDSVTPLTNALFPALDFPVYPFMFLLPNGDVFYAGSEDAIQANTTDGRILVIDYNLPPSQWTWSSAVIQSDLTGGSAVMYEPGKILKSGGPLNSIGLAVPWAERIDLSGYVSGRYLLDPPQWENAGTMTRSRHFHNLTLLPNGDILAIGGNSRGNGEPGESPNNPCEFEGEPIDEMPCDQGCPSVCIDYGGYYAGFGGETCSAIDSRPGCSGIELIRGCFNDSDCEAVLSGSTCVNINDDNGGHCRKACATDDDCGTLQGTEDACVPGQLESLFSSGMCNPGNNACYATLEAEVYDPDCDAWTDLDAQEFPRMYHSSALLMPDGRVLSMAGGHRGAVADQPISEYFELDYAPGNPPRPEITFGTDSPNLNYDGPLGLDVQGPAPSRFTLIRLGATTHGFDQDQRFIELNFAGNVDGSYTVTGPPDSAVAPAGYYMLFAISAEGQPSIGEYVHVGDEA